MSLVVVVTGCSDGGIGSELCKSFAKKGARVFATARRLEAMKDLSALGLETIALDVTNPKSIKAAAAEVEKKAGRIDILVNNAGMSVFGPVVEMSYEDMKKIFDTNVFGALLVAQAFTPLMVKQGSGKIVNVGSISGIVATPFAGGYCASKSAIHAFSDAMRLELKPFGIDVVVVTPGAIKSQFTVNSGVANTQASLIDSSIFAPVADLVTRRANESQKNATPTAEFAEQTVNALVKANPPSYYAYGRLSFILPFAKWLLPTWILDLILTKNAGLEKLYALVAATKKRV